jgi:hypothetical protein
MLCSYLFAILLHFMIDKDAILLQREVNIYILAIQNTGFGKSSEKRFLPHRESHRVSTLEGAGSGKKGAPIRHTFAWEEQSRYLESGLDS